MRRFPTSRNFSRIVEEAAEIYPRVRTWTRKTLKGRDSHHGYSHAQEVRALSRTLACADGVLSRDVYPLMYTIAILHDVADHKVDRDGKYSDSLYRFMAHAASPQLHRHINSTIARISLSYEKEHGTVEWERILTPAGVLIRNYVSDADKLLSLGPGGHARIVNYNECKILQDTYGDVGKISSEPLRELYASNHLSAQLYNAVNNVMIERMRSVPHYIRTPAAQLRARVMMDELFSVHQLWTSQFAHV
jgi:hypothetical protein